MHQFLGKWITDEEFFALSPRNVFHRQLPKVVLPCQEHRDRHILFRKVFTLEKKPASAKLFISADDYYKVYLNGKFIAGGPTPAYHFQYNYNELDITPYLQEGENTLAVHTLYQGLINRVWQSGDLRHGLILDLIADGKTILQSDETFKTAPHTGFKEMGTCGYETQFLEEFNSAAPEAGFERPDFDDSGWKNAEIKADDDHILRPQESKMLVYEPILPLKRIDAEGKIFLDFGAIFVGYLCLRAKGKAGDAITIRCGQELDESGAVRYALRANCTYEERWLLDEGICTLDQFDYKAFRYVELILPEGAELLEASLLARHYPFELKAKLKPEYARDEKLQKIWDLCVRSQQYGVQEVIQDCMEREKGFYLGDGCYTALTHMLLSGDDSMVRLLIDSAFSTDFITDTLVTCMNCSFMQEIAEFPLILVYLVDWHYRYSGDKEYLAKNYQKAKKLLEAYGREYEKEGLLCDLDKWCVVEWPKNFQQNYDAEILEGQICHDIHIAINAYYLAAVRTLNKIAKDLGEPLYREETPLMEAFTKAFWDEERSLFRDRLGSKHFTLVGNSFAFGFGLCEDPLFKENFIHWLQKEGIESLSLFCTFPALMGLTREGREDLIKECLLREGAWLRNLREGGTATFEGWGKDTKWNTSLFHLTMSYAAAFMADIDLRKILT